MKLREHVRAAERAYLEQLLTQHGAGQAAIKISGIHRATFWRKLRRHGLSPQDAAMPTTTEVTA